MVVWGRCGGGIDTGGGENTVCGRGGGLREEERRKRDKGYFMYFVCLDNFDGLMMIRRKKDQWQEIIPDW